MADSLFADILGMLGQKGVDQIARETGGDAKQTEAATGAAVGALLRGLADNSQDPGAAEAMIKALRRDHGNFDVEKVQIDTRQLDSDQTAKILRHILGEKQGKVEKQIGKATGVGAANMGKILASLAPIVMGMLAKRGQEAKVESGPDLSRWLGQQQQEMKQKKELGFLESLLDRDHDGDVDIGDMAGMLGKMLGGSR